MMDLSRTIRGYGLFGLMLALILPFTVSAAGPEDYRFPREPGTTKDGYPLPLSGKPIEILPIVVDRILIQAASFPFFWRSI